MKNNEIRQNYYYFADLLNAEINLEKCTEGMLEWVDIDEILIKEMPFTATECLKHYLAIGKNDDKLYTGASIVNGVNFIELKEF